MSHGISVKSECPYCGHANPRMVRAAIGSKLGDHHCDRCGEHYEEHYTVSVNVNTYAVAAQYRKPKKAAVSSAE